MSLIIIILTAAGYIFATIETAEGFLKQSAPYIVEESLQEESYLGEHPLNPKP